MRRCIILQIEKSNVIKIVNGAMQKVIFCVEENGEPLSSEKTLVFKFMWELGKHISNDNLKYDFEYRAYDDLSGSDSFLDLLVWTNDDFRVAFEFKLPISGSSNSNQTERKKQIYKDIARLKYLVDKPCNNIYMGFFVCAVNENAYLNMGQANPVFSVSHKHTSTIMEYANMKLPSPLCFSWDRIEWSKRNNKWQRIGSFAWLYYCVE